MSTDGSGETMARRDAERRKLRVGLALFIIYAVGYALFTLAGTFFSGFTPPSSSSF
jgi:hypothetical protein